jgi:predicted anti-sigma-YlaC factor YlaD
MTGMDCRQWREAISSMVDGEPAGIAEQLVVAHLQQCPSCRDFRAHAERLRRAARVQPAPEMPDLSRQIVAASSVARRANSWGLVRLALAVVSIEIIALSVPALLAGGDGAAAHSDRHLGAFSVAYGVALLVVVARPARARTVLPVAAVLAATLLLTAIVDAARGEIPLIDEAAHIPELVSVVLMWMMTAAGRRPADRDQARPALRVVEDDTRRTG